MSKKKTVQEEEEAQKAKERQQLAVLVVIVAIALVYCLVRFVVLPAFQASATASQETQAQGEKLQRAKRLLSRRSIMIEESTAIAESLHQVSQQYLPPPEDPLSWATDKLYSTARSVGIEIEWVEKQDRNLSLAPSRRQKKKKDEAEQVRRPSFKPFIVRILVECGYEQARVFIERLEQDNPYICISQVSISGQAHPERHKVILTAEWPMWNDTDEMASMSTFELPKLAPKPTDAETRRAHSDEDASGAEG